MPFESLEMKICWKNSSSSAAIHHDFPLKQGLKSENCVIEVVYTVVVDVGRWGFFRKCLGKDLWDYFSFASLSTHQPPLLLQLLRLPLPEILPWNMVSKVWLHWGNSCMLYANMPLMLHSVVCVWKTFPEDEAFRDLKADSWSKV